MNWRTLATVTACTVLLQACDKIPFLGKNKSTADTSATQTAQAPPSASSAGPDTTPAAPPPATPDPAPVVSMPSGPVTDEPWTPTDTGTVTPGMTRDQVVAVWGMPAQERATGPWSYLFFRNGCEASCGTFDVVFLENGQVVDAVVRGQGHYYAGVSSSPRERPAQFTPPGPGGSDS